MGVLEQALGWLPLGLGLPLAVEVNLLNFLYIHPVSTTGSLPGMFMTSYYLISFSINSRLLCMLGPTSYNGS